MQYFYIYGKDQKDYKVAQINLEPFKQIKSLKQLNELLTSQNLCNFSYISDIKNQDDIKIYNGIYKTNKVFFNSDTIKNNINKNLPITAILLIYRKDNDEEPIGYICLENNKLIYISKKEMLQKQFQTTNIANNGALFDVKEAKLPKIKIEELKYNIGTRVKYQDKEYKIAIKNTHSTDYAIIDETKHTAYVYQDEIESLNKIQEGNKLEEQKPELIFLNGKFKELYNKYKGQEVMKKSYIIQVKLAKLGEKYYNKLEDAHYVGKAGEAVLIGTQNEEWTTSIEKVCKKYTLINGEALTPEMLRETPIKIKTIVGENAEKVFAFHIKQNKNTTDKYGVKTSWAELTINSSKSEHGDGDWVVSYAKNGQIDENNLAVINGLVFKDTYQKWKESKDNNTLKINIDELWKQFKEKLFKIEGYNQFVGTIGNNGFDFKYTSDKIFSLVLKEDGLFHPAGEQTKNSLSELPKVSSLSPILLDNYTIKPEDLLKWIERHINKIKLWIKKNNFNGIIRTVDNNEKRKVNGIVNLKNNKVVYIIRGKEEYGFYYTIYNKNVKNISSEEFKGKIEDVIDESKYTVEFLDRVVKPKLITPITKETNTESKDNINLSLDDIINKIKNNELSYEEGLKKIQELTRCDKMTAESYLINKGISSENPYKKFSEELTKSLYNSLEDIGEININNLNAYQKSKIYYCCAENNVDYNDIINSLNKYMSKESIIERNRQYVERVNEKTKDLFE